MFEETRKPIKDKHIRELLSVLYFDLVQRRNEYYRNGTRQQLNPGADLAYMVNLLHRMLEEHGGLLHALITCPACGYQL